MGRIWVCSQTVVWVCAVVTVCVSRTGVKVVLNSVIHFERHVSIRHRLQKPRSVEPSRTWSVWVKLLLVTINNLEGLWCLLLSQIIILLYLSQRSFSNSTVQRALLCSRKSRVEQPPRANPVLRMTYHNSNVPQAKFSYRHLFITWRVCVEDQQNCGYF